MCSIVGIISKNGQDVYPQVLDLLYSMIYRGPDAFGINIGKKTIRTKNIKKLNNDFLPGSFGLGHGRLAVTGEGIQPVSSKNNEISVVHNGEIYNYRELGTKLSSSAMDSEAILQYFDNSNSFKKNATRCWQEHDSEEN